ncbi:COX15/CtaA family protein [Nocardioides sp. SYSU DS0651]|uniref:COX15/CtaA family protein n=1 Tax=Nocardioides sp. SYSU DS0651 TaxID=3415955 RepID=UPI003F4B403D
MGVSVRSGVGAVVERVERVLGPRLVPLAWANLVANVVIVVTGGAVRLTASGLGCPTWPQCTSERWTAHPELGLHGVIEFGNRLLTYVLIAIAVACWCAARARRDRDPAPTTWATIIALGIPAQALIGGVTVLTDLNPWVVALHMLVSMAMVAVCVVLLDSVVVVRRPASPPALRGLAWLALAVGWVVLYLGTVVTGSGPHAGDAQAPRNDLDPQLFSHVHAWAVYALVAVTLAAVVVAWRGGRSVAFRAAVGLLCVELAQGAVGFWQYFTDLPELLVGVHMLGAAVTSAALTWLVLATHPRS